MKKSAKFFREAAWTQLTGNWTPAVVFTLVYVVVVFAASVISEIPSLTSLSSNPDAMGSYVGVDLLFSLLFACFTYPLVYGLMTAFLNFKRTGEDVKVSMMFDGFKDFVRITLTNLLQTLYVVLWTILLIIPGIIKSIAYSQTNYILKDYPELKYNAAIERSMAMMKGHKMEFFLLSLSYIGWLILCILTLGVGLLWINPYVFTAYAHFYDYVKEDYERRIAA